MSISHIRLTEHAKKRMQQRGWSKKEVRHACEVTHDKRVIVEAVVITVLPKGSNGKQTLEDKQKQAEKKQAENERKKQAT